MNRREMLRLGGFAALSLPVIAKAGEIDGDELLESEEAYGGFTVRTRTIDDPPFEVDGARYERFHARWAIFSRMLWDGEFMERVDAVERVYQAGRDGYTHPDVALGPAAALCALYDRTNAPLMGMHQGLLGLESAVMDPPAGPTFEGRWDHNHLSGEEVAAIVKKASLFLGASLVGIAPLDKRWIYSGYFDPFLGGDAPIAFTEVEDVELPAGQVSPQEAGQRIKAELEQKSAEEIKALVVDTIESTDPALLPADAPPVNMVKVLPASQFKDKLSKFTTMPTAVLRVFAEKLGMDFEIAVVDPGESARPRYLDDGSLAIPETMTTVIVLAFEMDQHSIESCPTCLGDAATMDGYGKMAVTAGGVAQFLRKLGYNAIPCGNNTAMSIPQAIDAGLGEYGRNGLLITPKYGPRVRLAKVITDLPMAHDRPIRFGVEEFCRVCKKCAELCPTDAIPHGEPTREALNVSTSPGVRKWNVDAEQCYFGWTANGSGCGTCIRVCPFNKPEGWLHDATRMLIGAKAGSLDKLLVKLDTASGFGGDEPSYPFWDTDDVIHVKDKG